MQLKSKRIINMFFLMHVSGQVPLGATTRGDLKKKSLTVVVKLHLTKPLGIPSSTFEATVSYL